MKTVFEVASESVQIPGFRSALHAIHHVCSEAEIECFIVGALARDLILEHGHGEERMRATNDVDFAIAVDRWTEFERVAERLQTEHDFRRVGGDGHRLLSPEGTQVDLVPFGGVETADRVVEWPSDDHRALTTLGFREVSRHTVRVRIDDAIDVQVASLPGLAVLKLLAWKDRRAETTRDAGDFCRLLKAYYDVAGSRLWDEHGDLLDEENFVRKEVGARMLGRDAVPILQQGNQVETALRSLLDEQTENRHESALAEAMDCFVPDEDNFDCLAAFRDGIEEGLQRERADEREK